MLAALWSTGCGGSRRPAEPADAPNGTAAAALRVALFNVRELSLEKIRAAPADEQVAAAARIVARVRPDVLVVQEIDWVDGDDALAARELRDRHLGPAGAPEYPYVYAAPSNTGELTGLDLDGDGHVATAADRGERRHGNDSYGFGVYPGQYAMAVLSRFPFDAEGARTFRRLLWADLPGNLLPTSFYPPEVRRVFRLSSKSHWDLPVLVPRNGSLDPARLRLLVSHPTPQGFDGDEDRNGRRNFDEIRLWSEYLDGAEWIVDDQGRRGGGGGAAPFVIVGDLNARPNQEPVYGRTAISQLLEHHRVRDSGDVAVSEGATTGRAPGPPDFWERGTSGRGSRIDYVLPSRDLEIAGGGVFWPDPDVDPEGAADAELASDHRLVWLDLLWVPGDRE